MNPYTVLGVASNADDKEIRKAYLEAIKVATPEAHPRRFQTLNRAYESIKNKSARCKYSIENIHLPGHTPLDSVLRFAQHHLVNHPLPYNNMLEHLKKCAKS
jgi:curved DNA-binding protein CbpA